MQNFSRTIKAILAVLPIINCAFISDGLAGGGVVFRNDVADVVYSDNGGSWGSWQLARYCLPGTYAHGFGLKVEEPLGDGDDTALNNVQLFCASPSLGSKGAPVSSDGEPDDWGKWTYKPPFCQWPSFIKGFKLRVEESLGEGDDTAANDMRVLCDNNKTLTVPNGGKWGDWSKDYKVCPGNSRVCGLSLKIEARQGGGDDTAVNDVALFCCN